MNTAFSIRLATLDDIPTLVAHRRAMFTAMGHTDPAALDAMEIRFRPWVEHRMRAGDYFTWLAVADPTQAVIGGAALWLQDWPAGPHNLTECRGYVLNVYTHPDYRRRGIARQLMLVLLAYCQERHIPIVSLHASVHGRHLYETLGFEPTNYLTKKLSQP